MVYDTSIPKTEKHLLVQNIGILKNEITAVEWYRFDIIWDRFQLSELLMKYSKDNIISLDELHDWNGKFSSRDILDSKEFERYVRDK